MPEETPIVPERNYIEIDNCQHIRVAYVHSVSTDFVTGFYWRFNTHAKSGFKIKRDNFLKRFLPYPREGKYFAHTKEEP